LPKIQIINEKGDSDLINDMIVNDKNRIYRIKSFKYIKRQEVDKMGINFSNSTKKIGWFILNNIIYYRNCNRWNY
jgi:hypothetical protein